MAVPSLIAIGVAGWASGGSVPVGPVFQVNTYTTDTQEHSSVATDAAGNFVVVWDSYHQDGSLHGIFAQRYDCLGSRRGSEFQVNTSAINQQRNPDVSSDAAGNFVVVWDRLSFVNGFYQYRVFARRYDAGGEPIGLELDVNGSREGAHRHGVVSSDPEGNFVVVWQSQPGSDYGIFAQRFSSTGQMLGQALQINSDTCGSQVHPKIGSDLQGNFVILWSTYDSFTVGCNPDEVRKGIYVQRLGRSGAKLGPQLEVDTVSRQNAYRPSIGVAPNGEFVVVWQQDGLFGRRFDSLGQFQGNRFQITDQRHAGGASVSVNAEGGFLVAWESAQVDSSDILVRFYDSAGNFQSSGLQVDLHSAGYQVGPRIGHIANDRFIVVWTSLGPDKGFGPPSMDGSKEGIFGRLLVDAPPVPTSMRWPEVLLVVTLMLFTVIRTRIGTKS